jgi:hypothetical protein
MDRVSILEGSPFAFEGFEEEWRAAVEQPAVSPDWRSARGSLCWDAITAGSAAVCLINSQHKKARITPAADGTSDRDRHQSV